MYCRSIAGALVNVLFVFQTCQVVPFFCLIMRGMLARSPLCTTAVYKLLYFVFLFVTLCSLHLWSSCHSVSWAWADARDHQGGAFVCSCYNYFFDQVFLKKCAMAILSHPHQCTDTKSHLHCKATSAESRLCNQQSTTSLGLQHGDPENLCWDENLLNPDCLVFHEDSGCMKAAVSISQILARCFCIMGIRPPSLQSLQLASRSLQYHSLCTGCAHCDGDESQVQGPMARGTPTWIITSIAVLCHGITRWQSHISSQPGGPSSDAMKRACAMHTPPSWLAQACLNHHPCLTLSV